MGSKGFIRESFKYTITRDQEKDTGMAMVLILMILALVFKQKYFLLGGMGLLALDMIAPQLYRPVAITWIGMSHLLGSIMSKVILSIIFLIIVTPVGLYRRIFCGDSLKLKSFKNGEESVFEIRNHTYTRQDLDKPF